MDLKAIYSRFPEPHRTELLERLRYNWTLNARPTQVPSTSNRFQVIVGGRGSGKTRAGAEWIREKAQEPDLRFLIVGRSITTIRDTIIEGESGILNVSPVVERPLWRPSGRMLQWANGSAAFCATYSSYQMLRGVRSHFTWFDEPGYERDELAFEVGNLATSLGTNPQVLITGTARTDQSDLWAELANSAIWAKPFRGEKVSFYHNATTDNKNNLASQYLTALMETYDGTPSADRELFGLF